jgi:hypothetical protein
VTIPLVQRWCVWGGGGGVQIMNRCGSGLWQSRWVPHSSSPLGLQGCVSREGQLAADAAGGLWLSWEIHEE